MRNGQENIRKILSVIISISGWIFVVTTLLWFGTSLFSLVFFKLSKEDLYIPDSVKMSYYSFLLLICWIIFVFILSTSWHRYNSFILQKEAKNEKENVISNLLFINEKINWSEAVISKVSTLNILEEVDVLKNNLMIVQENKSVTETNITKMEPHQLLSLATSFMKKCNYAQALSIFRVLLEHKDASPIILKISKIKMSQCLYKLGYNGIANSLAE